MTSPYVALAHGRVGAQQMVVDDDHVGFGGALAHQRHEAVAVARALGAEAGVGLGGNLASTAAGLRAGPAARRDRRSSFAPPTPG